MTKGSLYSLLHKARYMLPKNISYYLLVGVTALTSLLYSCENNPEEVNNLNSKKKGVEEAVNVRINYTTGGMAKAVLTAPLMYRVQDTVPYIEFPNSIHVDFYKDSLIESKLDAHYAKYSETQSRVFLKDSVRLTNTLGDTLYCQELYWDRNRTGTEFYTDKPIRIRTHTHIINGIGLESSQDFKNRHIMQTTGYFKVPTSEFPQ